MNATAFVLGLLSFIGTLAWAGLIILSQSLSGMGDGASSGSSRDEIWLGYSGSLYLFLVFVCCLPRIKFQALKIIGSIAHGILFFFAIGILGSGGLYGMILLIPFAGFAAGWYALYKSKLKKHNARYMAE